MEKRLAFLISLALITSIVKAQIYKSEGVSVILPDNPTREQVVELATQVRPSYRQLDYQEREMLGFIHIGMNTFSGVEWGTGKELPSLFNPTQLNADKWVKVFKDAGLTGVILVAKHHDGFCVWPSKFTEHTVAHSPWRNGKGDLVKDVSDACRKYGMKFCVYLSPWDMHEPTYGTAAYNDHYISQLEELLTHYGPVYLLWFDGAGTETSVSGKSMPFDWERIFKRARELQPDVLLSGNAPDIRWVGNEKGKGRETEWSVQGINNGEKLFGTLVNYNYRIPNLGSIEDLMHKKRLVWYPSRGGLPLRKGWFYNANDDNTTKSLSYLVDSYFSTVGHNSNLLPNLSPDKTGRIPEKDAQRLIQFGKIISKMKSVDYAKGAKIVPVSGWTGDVSSSLLTDNSPYTSWHTSDGVVSAVAEVYLAKAATVNVIKLQENVRDFGQRIERFAIDVKTPEGWKELQQGTTIGFRRMIRLDKPVRADAFRLRFLEARKSLSIGNISLYYLEDIPEETAQNQNIQIDPKHVRLDCLGFEKTDDNNAVIDGNPDTSGHFIVNHLPVSLVLTLDKKELIKGFSYLPSVKSDGHIDFYRIFVSEDGRNWGKPIASGRFGNIENNPVEQFIPLESRSVKSIKIVIDKITSEHKSIMISELKLFK